MTAIILTPSISHDPWIDQTASKSVEPSDPTDTIKAAVISDKSIEPKYIKMSFRDILADDWFYDDAAYVLENGLINDTNEKTLDPQDNAVRAQITAIMHRFIEKFVK